MAPEEQISGFTVTVVGDGVSVERTVDATRAGEVMAVLLGAPRPQHVPRGEDSPSTMLGSKSEEIRPRLALREYLEDTGATRFPEKILVIGDYLTEHGGQDDFSREDAKSAFQKAREVLPRNLPRDFGSAVQNGWIAELAAKPGRFYVTNRGKEAIARKFVQDGPRPATRRRRGTRGRQGLSDLSADASE